MANSFRDVTRRRSRAVPRPRPHPDEVSTTLPDHTVPVEQQRADDPVRGRSPDPAADAPTLFDVLGGRREALDATLPTVAFVVALLAAGRYDPEDRLWWSLGSGVAVALAVAAWRAGRGHQVRAAVLGLLPVLGGAIIAARTGRAEDFFAVRILSNAVSALIWAGSIWVGRPLLGVITGSVLRQKGAWRRDPDLYRGYTRASWWWTASFVLRTVVLGGLYFASAPVLLGIVQIALSWPLFTLLIVVCWRVLKGALPPGHPGLLHPQPRD